MRLLIEYNKDFDWVKEVKPGIHSPYVGMKWVSKVHHTQWSDYWDYDNVYTIVDIDDKNMYLNWGSMSDYKYDLETYYGLVEEGRVKEVFEGDNINENFDWVKEVKPFDLNNEHWIISVDNATEYYEVQDYLADNGWSWDGEDTIGVVLEWEEVFNHFMPVTSRHETLYKKFDCYRLGMVIRDYGDSIIHKWSELKSVIKEDFDWAETPDTITTESDISHFINKDMYHIDLNTGQPVAEDEGRVQGLRYWISNNGEEPEAYNVCWDEVVFNDEEGTENVYRTCTRFRASTIVRMFRNGEFRFMTEEELDEHVIKENFDWVEQVPDVEFGDYFNVEDLNERIFFENNNVIFQLDWEDFNELTTGGYEDYFFKDVVVHNGTYENEGDSDYFDDEEINYLPGHLTMTQLNRLEDLLQRSAKVFDLDNRQSKIDTMLTEQFQLAEEYIGRNLYRGRNDWDDMTGNYMYELGKRVNINRWKSLNAYYLNLLKEHGVNIEGSGWSEGVTIVVPFPYKPKTWSHTHNTMTEGNSITNLTDIIKVGLNFLDKPWSDYWYEDFDTSGLLERFSPEFDRFLDKIEEAIKTQEGVDD